MSDRLIQHIEWHLEWNYQLIGEWVEWLAGKEYAPHCRSLALALLYISFQK